MPLISAAGQAQAGYSDALLHTQGALVVSAEHPLTAGPTMVYGSRLADREVQLAAQLQKFRSPA